MYNLQFIPILNKSRGQSTPELCAHHKYFITTSGTRNPIVPSQVIHSQWMHAWKKVPLVWTVAYNISVNLWSVRERRQELAPQCDYKVISTQKNDHMTDRTATKQCPGVLYKSISVSCKSITPTDNWFFIRLYDCCSVLFWAMAEYPEEVMSKIPRIF